MAQLKSGVVHTIPKDLRDSLSPMTISIWNDLTPLARNEWLCWVTSAVKLETRQKRIKRLVADITTGKKRPCCFAGCPHR